MNTPTRLIMIRPVQFGFNDQTADSNSFQHRTDRTSKEIQSQAQEEFDEFVAILRKEQIDVTVFEDTFSPTTPDSIFPNNWISLHENNSLILYPMLAPNRRAERRTDIIQAISNNTTTVIDLTKFELENKFLEGTGSIVFDYGNKKAYACISPRTDAEILTLLCDHLGFKPIVFRAVDKDQQAIYHTNVVMCLGNGFALVGLDSIPEEKEQHLLLNELHSDGLEVITLSGVQLNQFAGNMYQVFNKSLEPVLIMSQQAYNALLPDQLERLKQLTRLLPIQLTTIETIGGGSARCMLAENRLPLNP